MKREKLVLATKDELVNALYNVINNLKSEIEREYPNLSVSQKFAILDSRFNILTSFGKPDLIKVDLGEQDA